MAKNSRAIKTLHLLAAVKEANGGGVQKVKICLNVS